MSLRKLRNASLDELRVRASQRVSAFRERQGWSPLTHLPTDDALAQLFSHDKSISPLDHFRTRSAPLFFQSFNEDAIKEFSSRWPKVVQHTIDEANQLCKGKFNLLGFKDLSFGEPIDWHLEPLSAKRIPLLHWSKLDFLDARIAGDKKITWELNRHQYFSKLGQAYTFTGDETYARAFVSHLESWMEANPPKLGINWASSLEIAFRSISWLWAFQFFKNSSSLLPATFQRALKFLYLNARHLESYLSTYFSPNTHLTGEALGLFYLGVLLPEFKGSERWQQLGTKILVEQLPIHVKADGVYFEQSSYYHRYTTDFYIHFLILARANGKELAPEVERSLTLLLEHLMYITRPDGLTPLFGDDDGGRVVKLDSQPADDFRSTLAIGSVLFDRGDLKFVSGNVSEELFWLLGSEGLKKFASLKATEPTRTSKAFNDGGYFVMRDGWTSDANYLLFDCGPHGTLNCGHAHADALSINLTASGKSLLVDPGTFTYTGSEEMRNWFRSSHAHNTVVIDDQSSSLPEGPFSWRSIASCELESWITTDRFDYVSGRHDGYRRLPDPVSHTRSLLFLKHEYWVMRDKLDCKNRHKAELRFQLNSKCEPELLNAGERQFFREGSTGFEIHSFSPGALTSSLENGQVSKCYGEKKPAQTFVSRIQLQDGADLISFLMPLSSSGPRQVREIKTAGGQTFALSDKSNTDIVMIRTERQLECGKVLTTFEWLWARFSSTQPVRLARLLAVSGTSISIDGETILDTGRQVKYVEAQQSESGFVIASEGEKLSSQSLLSRFEEVYHSILAGDIA